MSDIRIKYFQDSQEFDLDIKNWELEFDDGLETAVLVSLFTDSRIDEEDLPAGETDKRGFWGDAVDNDERTVTGSKLWLLERSILTDDTVEQAREYVEEALQWLLDDEIAESVTVETSMRDSQTLQIDIEILRPQGQNSVNSKFNYVWQSRGGGIHKTYV